MDKVKHALNVFIGLSPLEKLGLFLAGLVVWAFVVGVLFTVKVVVLILSSFIPVTALVIIMYLIWRAL